MDITYWSKVFGKNNEIKVNYGKNLDISTVIMAGGEAQECFPLQKYCQSL